MSALETVMGSNAVFASVTDAGSVLRGSKPARVG